MTRAREVRLGRRDNSFDGLRLLAALAVVVGHAYVLTRHGPAPRIGGVPIHELGVDAFFVLSGRLVTESWMRDPSLRRFLARRVLRIGPALLLLVVVTMLVIGPAVTSLPLSEYFGESETWHYLLNAALVGVYDLPGVFAGHWTSAVNGSLWTLGLEFVGYLVVPLSALARSRSLPLAMLLVVGVVLVAMFGREQGLGASGRVWVFFAVGGLARRLLPAHVPLRPVFALVALWLALGIVRPDVAVSVSWVAVPALVLAVGARPVPVLRRAARFGDLSYGTYLWGFVVQQLVVERCGDLPVAIDVPVVLALTAGIAWFSWHAVEAPMLERKPRPASGRTILLTR